MSWLKRFHNYKLSNLHSSVSSHSTILLQCTVSRWMDRKRRFKFENFLLSKPDIYTIIKDSWEGSKGRGISQRISMCTQNLRFWSKSFNSDFRKEASRIHKDMEAVRGHNDDMSIYIAIV
ncbi:hypothetical protein MANES_03G084616v8 [Manihot esculenta]|uniref:Uncharacterized protein n=1 Tax=Manihot esculenta TaxID=3983 RepID=A0ACB7HY40_MANES|nr:hypothetical protein MANES_03G084616v8 [Manihot esculenta]